MKKHRTSKAGFTAKEMLVTLVCTLILLFLVFALVLNPRVLINQNNTRLLANGMGIYRSVFTGVTDVASENFVDPTVLPSSSSNPRNPEFQFANSTDYFKYLVTHDIMHINWSYFAGHDIPSAQGKYDPADPNSTEGFQADNNAWCVVANLHVGERIGTPFLISRNLQGTRLFDDYQEGEAPVLEGPPYGKRTLIVIRIGGSGEAMQKKNILWKNLNPAKANNPILRP